MNGERVPGHSLPSDTATFTGRDEELRIITTQLTAAASRGNAVMIHAISGMPGAGKTALAVHAAHLLRDRFPDRQLFIDLHAHTPGQDPALPQEALADLLAAAGVDSCHIPADPEGRSALWRDRMAGRRALLVLDNAASSSQVIPLLPRSEHCLVLITSRRPLEDMSGPVDRVLLTALPPDAAHALFLRLAPRAATEPKATVQEMVGLAGYLPLAISLLARVYARHTARTLAQLTEEATSSMLAPAAQDRSAAAAFEVSYRFLPYSHQQFFRRLALRSETTIGADAAAALASIPLHVATGYLEALDRTGLLNEAGDGQYGMHDLIRRYAQDRAASGSADRENGLSRLLAYYQHAAEAADAYLSRYPRSASPSATVLAPRSLPSLRGRDDAHAWMIAEHANLLASIDYAVKQDRDAPVVGLTAAIAAHLRSDGPWSHAITLHAAAETAARRLGDRLAEADALINLGVVRGLSGDYPGAIEACQRATAVHRELGNRIGEANALIGLGVAQRVKADYPGARAALNDALIVYRERGNQLGQANSLRNLGIVQYQTGDCASAFDTLNDALALHRKLGDEVGQAETLAELGVVRQLTADYPGAIEASESALTLHREVGNRLGQANVLLDLGIVRRLIGNYPEAIEAGERSLTLYRELGSRLGQVNALICLGIVWRVIGDYSGATQALQQALSLNSAHGHRPGRAIALTELGAVLRATGDYSEATQVLQQALALYREVGNRNGEANALTTLGGVRHAAGDYPGATQALGQALQELRELGDPGGEAEALNRYAEIFTATGRHKQARACHAEALKLSRKIAAPLDEAEALEGIGESHLRESNNENGVIHLREALAIYQYLGVPGAERVQVRLAELASTE